MYRSKIELHNVDCLPFMKQCKDKQFDLAIVDPPYGIGANKMTLTSIQKIVKKYLHPKASYHLLRHAFATYALDEGTELAPLSKSLGHQNTKTTEIYYHTSIKTLKTIKQVI